MGACQEIAQRLGQAAHHVGLQIATVADLNALARDLDANSTAARNVLIVTSTYNGQPPDNARLFAQRLASGSLSCAGLRYAVLGCGNSQWSSTFQRFPIDVDAALEKLGGVRVHARGLADANADWDEPIEQFERSIWASFVPNANLASASRTGDVQDNAFKVDLVDAAAIPIDYTAGSDIVEVEVVENRELVQDDGPRSIRHLELRLPTGGQSNGDQYPAYQAGDHLGVLPRNSESVIDALCGRLRLSRSQTIRIESVTASGSDANLPFNRPISIEQLMRDYLDLQAPLSRKAVARLASLTDCPPEKAALQSASDDWKASEIAANRDTLSVVLDRYQSLQPSIADLLDLMPLLKPRYYSISSSPRLDGASTVTLTVGRLLWTDARGQSRYGLCSDYLSGIRPGDRIKAWLRPAPISFHLPTDARRPLLMVGPGTGVAPMRSFIRERIAEARAGAEIGPIVLVFGCRNQLKDFLYGDEFKGYAVEFPGKFTLLTAFSRDGPRKHYVQDVIRSESSRIADLIASNAKIFVCGDAKSMAPAVRQAIADCAGAKRPNLVQDLIASADYVEDIWASMV